MASLSTPAFRGMKGFNNSDRRYSSASGIAPGSAAGTFSGLLAISPQVLLPTGNNPEFLFGSADNSSGWGFARLVDPIVGGNNVSYVQYGLLLGFGVKSLAGLVGDNLNRAALLGFSYNNGAVQAYVNGGVFQDVVVAPITPGAGLPLRLGGTNSIDDFDGTHDTIMGAAYDSGEITPAEMAAIFAAWRATGSIPAALAIVGHAMELVYDFAGTQPALPAPALVNQGTAGVSGNLTFGSVLVDNRLTPQVVANELVSQTEVPAL